MKSGATDYLTKPSEIDELLEKVDEAFERRRRLEEKIRNIQNHQTPQEK
jgi:FixJ family two-component response regulator